MQVSILGYESSYSNVAMAIIKSTDEYRNYNYCCGNSLQCALITFKDNNTILVNGKITTNKIYYNSKGMYFIKYKQRYYIDNFLKYDNDKAYNVEYVKAGI